MTSYTQNFGLALPDFRQGPWHDLLNSDLTKIDALLYSSLSGANVDVWANNTAYSAGTSVVDDSDASIWLCAVSHTSAAAPTTFTEDRLANPTHWTRLLTGFAPRGQWTNATNYFPYDLVYDPHLGIMALCNLKHVSNASGNIKDDAAYWAFLIDMSNADLAAAITVTYSGATSGIPATDVQHAIDFLETQIVGLNNVNITQGSNISALQSADTAHDSRLTAVEGKNTTQDSSLTSLTARVTALESAPPPTPFPSGTKMLFYSATAPTGWVTQNGVGDRAIRVVNNDGTGGVLGGSIGFNTVFAQTVVGNHTNTLAETISHSHGGYLCTVLGSYGPTFTIYLGSDSSMGLAGFGPEPAVGSSQPHNHPMDIRVAYINVCVGQKS